MTTPDPLQNTNQTNVSTFTGNETIPTTLSTRLNSVNTSLYDTLNSTVNTGLSNFTHLSQNSSGPTNVTNVEANKINDQLLIGIGLLFVLLIILILIGILSHYLIHKEECENGCHKKKNEIDDGDEMDDFIKKSYDSREKRRRQIKEKYGGGPTDFLEELK
ncbi:hypothetical protein HEP_00180600 [Hepatocystis sp. ex Piliocolobus tephrosceles]|nr:hypothetical protein HEP_00180600 [Hepatocystis sp. ex Piliocolobus tephrosceles]